ncbi:type VI secretion system lipoprotein TssJ [Shewanella psychropiezotolerans]|uniref:Type VI secretion system lipoprotein TssJ n=1 Tax=Shewanella psychropiezotolerans TaxID=2593655 RepID=A0ABX5X5I9_9GAMM|nr:MULTISPECIES: type VI secretion system lipoprotein TssJ [Shewanella]MPY26914.1 type VI secretion system lipoprotein TssJ [Shewanella sp. YLB-07]QDO86621.1 type VI secretion system lipoprotein TssJ [Shewanella psychropiezotolerans]
MNVWLILTLTGCSLWGDPVEPKLFLDINSGLNINPNIERKPSPVEIRVYQLSDNQAFSQANFMQIFHGDQGVLKANLLVVRRLASVMPGEQRKEVIPLSSETKFIGVIAGFSNYREAKNKVIYKVIELEDTEVNVSLDGINLSISSKEEE